MKKIFVVLFGLLAAGQVFAQVVNQVACTGANAAGNGNPILASANSFLQTDVQPKCSANVLMNYSSTAIGFATAAASIKGKYVFSGNTGGGAVAAGPLCPATGCVAATLTTPLATALGQAT